MFILLACPISKNDRSYDFTSYTSDNRGTTFYMWKVQIWRLYAPVSILFCLKKGGRAEKVLQLCLFWMSPCLKRLPHYMSNHV